MTKAHYLLHLTVLLVGLGYHTCMGQSYLNALPKVGDIKYSCEHLSKVEPFMVSFDNKENWDFNFLLSYWSIKEVYKDAKSSKHFKLFPTATLVLCKMDGEEEFFFTKNGGLYSLGKVIDVTYNAKGREVIRYEPHRLIMVANKKVNQFYDNGYKVILKFAQKDMLDGTTLIQEKYDSLFVEVSMRENAKITDEGNIIYSNTSKKVQKHEVIVTPLVKIKVKNQNDLNWKVYEKKYLSFIPDELSDFIFNQKFSRVDFICPDYKGILLSYTIQNSSIGNFYYQDEEPSPYMRNINYDTFDAIANPNPTTGNVSVRLFNYPFDNYSLELYNVVGKKIFTKAFTRKSGRNLKTDISSLKKGTYLYSVLDAKGRKLITKRISLIGT
jgi:Secretion system C-terminal sorting domain